MANSLKKIVESMNDQPWQFSLHQALFMLELSNQNKARFGCGKTLQDEPAILKAYCNFTAPTSDCVEYKTQNNENFLTINQTSLIGINGILPQQYTEKILEGVKNKNNSLLDFINILNHRQFGMQHKLEKKVKNNLNIDHDAKNFVSTIAGLHQQEKWSKIIRTFSGALWQKTKTPQALKTILQTIFQREITIKQFIEKWIDIDPHNQCILNGEKLTDKVIGKSIRCKHTAIQIIISLDTLDQYEQFLPTSENYALMQKICKYYVTPGLQTIIILHLSKIKPTRLSKQKKLGYNVWLESHENTAFE